MVTNTMIKQTTEIEMMYCPICDTQFKAFARVSPRKSRKAKCPNCGSLERHRFFWLLLRQEGFLPQGGRMLHFAPEPWLIDEFRARYGLGYIMADYELPPYDIQVDIQAIPFNGGFFDGLIAFGVLEHIPNDLQAMSELLRILAPGGKAFIHVPLQFETYNSWRERLGKVQRRKLYGQSNHLRYYGLEIQEDLEKIGFSYVEIIKPSNHFSESEIMRFGLTDSSRIIVARK